MSKGFKRREGKDQREKRSFGPKKQKEEGKQGGFPKRSGNDKKEKGDKPVFERYRDDSRPSDFGSSKNSRNSGSPYPKKSVFKKEGFADKKGKRSFRDDKKTSFVKKPANPFDLDESDYESGSTEREDKKPKFRKQAYERKPYVKKTGKGPSKPQKENEDGTVRLNKYIANAGICSRREADDLIASGVVQVNGKTITEMGYKVKPADIIRYGGQTLKKERLVYLLLNKPKDYITTADDPQKRRTVLELIQGACRERIYPVGRLDRATTGLLMFTNDGDLTKKLTHPRYGVRKIYHVELDKPLKREDLDKITAGLELEDGPIQVDEITYVGDGKDKTQVGIEIHSGKNRIVRRIFEQLGYNVRKLDRVMFGSLTKKDLPRGRWRMLTESEVGILKMISSGK